MTTPYTPLRTSPISSPPSRGLSPSPAHSPSNSLRALEFADPDGKSVFGRLQRSSTVTNLGSFDFRDGLLPLTLSGDDDSIGREGKGDEKHVGLVQGQFIVSIR